MTRTSIVAWLVSAGAVTTLHSQLPASPVVASISGHVVDGITSEPIASAVVTLQPAHKPAGSCGVSNVGTGQFLCEVYEAGEFQLSANRRGYSVAGFGMRTPDDMPQPFDLAPGEHATDVTLRLWKNGTISGRALDADGDPIVNASISAIGVFHSGPTRFLPPRTTTTDDRGIYRVADASPGDYVIALTRGRSLSAPSMPIFHPSALSLAGAKTVHLSAATDLMDIDLVETRARTFNVSGALLGRSAARPMGYESRATSVRLIPADAPETPPGFDVADTDAYPQVGGNGARDRGGAFTLTNVPPGKYLLRVVDYPRLAGPSAVSSFGRLTLGFPREPVPLVDTLWAEMPVTVTDHDVTDLPATLQRAARLTGRVVFDDASVNQTPGDAPVILLRTDGRDDGDRPYGFTEADGTFRTVGVPPGRYALVALPPPNAIAATTWRMASTLMNGHDLIDRSFDVGTTDISDVVVTLRQVTTISGTVRDASGAPRPDASLYVFSTDRTRWDPQGLPPTTTPWGFRPNQHGQYHTAVPPGEYYVAAGTEALGEWQTPEKLAELAKTATRISIASGEQKALDIAIR